MQIPGALVSTVVAALAVAASFLVPLTLPGPDTLRLVGAALAVLGLTLIGLAARALGTWRVWGAPADLTRRGVYRTTRNPIDLGLVVVVLALGPLLLSWWPVILTPVALVAVFRLAVRHEEDTLDAALGADYRAYRRRTPRWI